MPKLILKSPYLKNDAKGGTKRSGYLKYIATREGVALIPKEKSALPASRKQRQLIAKLLGDFPDVKELFEYADYLQNPTMGNASELIGMAVDTKVGAGSGSKIYAQYIATRPGAELAGSHGLFSDTPVESLAFAMREIDEHRGNIWTHNLSLKREDAARLGFDNAAAWRDLLREQRNTIAQAMRIPANEFRWYAAFHNAGHHPHVHMMAFSADPQKGYLTREGIQTIRSSLTNSIFRDEMYCLYEQKSNQRDALVQTAREELAQLLGAMETGGCDCPALEQKLPLLAERLRHTSGKKVYGYLKAPVKALVDEIVDSLAAAPPIAAAYGKWQEIQREVLLAYSSNPPDPPPLSKQKEFKAIKNAVIQEALRLQAHESIMEDDAPEDAEAEKVLNEYESENDEEPLSDLDEPEDSSPRVEWSERYRQARGFLFGGDGRSPDFEKAFALFHQEALSGNALAMHDLGRMYADGLGRDPDREQARTWYAKALDGFLAAEDAKPGRYLKYRIGKMYAAGLGTDKDDTQAAEWFTKAANQGYKFAQYSLAGLYRRGQGVEQNDEEAFRLYTGAASQGVPYATFELGKLHRDGIGREADSAKSDAYFSQAFLGFHSLEEQSHDDKLQYRLGWMLLHGVGTTRDEAAARAYFEQASRLGNPHAQYQLAKLILADPDAVPDETARALEWLEKASDKDYEAAQYTLGKLYRDGEKLTKDIPKAAELFARAADTGNSYAAYALGKLYLAGTELSRDVPVAINWLRRSAALGNDTAQYRLGKLLLQGADIPKNVDEALRFLTSSAEAGNPFAQYALGKLYLRGREIRRDVEQAKRWLTLSAAQGNIYAQSLLDHPGADPMLAATRLMHHLSNLFRDSTPPASPVWLRIDRKRRRVLQEKKRELGHAKNDQEPTM